MVTNEEEEEKDNPVNALMVGNEEEEEVNLTDVTLVSDDNFCEAQGKGRAKGGPRKVTQRTFMDGGWWMVDGGIPFPDALH